MTRTDHSKAAAEATLVGVRLTKFRDPLQIPPVLRPSPMQLLTIRMRTEQVR